MSPARLSVFFRHLDVDLEHSAPESIDLGRLCLRAAQRVGGDALGQLTAESGDMDAAQFADRLRANPKLFGELESEAIARGVAHGPLGQVAAHAADHYDRLARTDSPARTAALVPVLALSALVALVAVFSIEVIPRFADAFRALAKPWLTRAVIYGAILFKVVILPLAATAVLLAVVLAFYWRTPEGQARLSRAALRVPWLGEVLARWSAARFCAQAAFGCQMGDAPADAVAHASACCRCEPLRAALGADADAPRHPAFADIRDAVERTDSPHGLADRLLAEFSRLQPHLGFLSQRIVAASQIALVVLTLVVCALVVSGMLLALRTLSESVSH